MSITKVASLAGVSKSTVSRVINQSAKVAPEVIRAVQSAMDKIGYRPPLRRRGPKPLSRRGIRTGNIALIGVGLNATDFYRMPVFPALLHGVERGLAEQGLSLILANISKDEGMPAVLSNGQADGVLLWGKWDAMPDAIRVQLRQIPAAWIVREHSDDEGEFDHVFYNNAGVGRLAARYLLQKGHRSLGFLNGNPLHTAFVARQNDFVAAAAKAGADVRLAIREPLDQRPDYVMYEELVARLLDGTQARPTGVFVPSDAQMPPVYHALQVRGVQPGRDVQFVSCDNEEQFLARLSPRPVTIHINLELVGRRAVQQLLWRMRNPERKNRISVLVEPTLVESPGLLASGNGDHSGNGFG